jgi:F0F1-type ATP synthase assembly protein I
MEKKKQKPFNAYLKYGNLGFQMLAAIAFPMYLGMKLDQYLENKTPYAAGLMALLGVFAGIYLVIKQATDKE